MKPIRLLWLVLLIALGWSAWWLWGAWSAERNLTNWMEDRRAAGWQAEWVLRKVLSNPARVARGDLAQGELGRRLSLMWTASTGRW